MTELKIGLGKGKIYPAAAASHLLNPLRSLVQPASRIVDRMGLCPDDRVLELGCGPGWFSRSLSSSIPNGQLVLCDYQPKMLQIAHSRVVQTENTVAVAANATALPYQDRTFDKVLVASMLGEVPDRTSCLQEVKRVLKNSGTIIIVETRRDSDFVTLTEVCSLARQLELDIARTYGWRWEFTVLLRPRV
ncbi:MAG: class I SAM-dependent methyltransferase [Actinomycetota bacterium]